SERAGRPHRQTAGAGHLHGPPAWRLGRHPSRSRGLRLRRKTLIGPHRRPRHLSLRTFHGRGAGFRCKRIPLARQDLRRALVSAMWRLAFAESLVVLLSAVLWLMLETASMADDWRAAIEPGVIAAVFAGTDFGRVWLFRLFPAVALTAVVLLRPQQ